MVAMNIWYLLSFIAYICAYHMHTHLMNPNFIVHMRHNVDKPGPRFECKPESVPASMINLIHSLLVLAHTQLKLYAKPAPKQKHVVLNELPSVFQLQIRG